MNLEKLQKTLEESGVPADVIANVLSKQEEDNEKEAEIRKNSVSVSEAAVYLNDRLDEKWNEAKVRRYIATADITPELNPGNAKKLGYRIMLVELDRFIADSKKTKDDWKREAQGWKAKYEELKAQMDASVDATKSVVSEETTLLHGSEPEAVEEMPLDELFEGLEEASETVDSSQVVEPVKKEENANTGHSEASETEPEVKKLTPAQKAAQTKAQKKAKAKEAEINK